MFFNNLEVAPGTYLGFLFMIQFRKPILTLIGIMFFSLALAQDYTKDPKANERVIGNVTASFDQERTISADKIYSILLEKAKKEYPQKNIDLRNVRYDYSTETMTNLGSKDANGNWTPNTTYTVKAYSCSAKVVEFISHGTQLNETLVKALDKATSNIYAGSRFAIAQISVSGEFDREIVKDQLLDILLDRSYRVVAKEYLEKLKEELEEQTSGGYNERKTAKTDNLSGVGYFLNVRVNEKSIRVQVINVSTGEYEGNATVDF